MGQEPEVTSTGQEPEMSEPVVGRRYWLIDGVMIPIIGGAEENEDGEDEDDSPDDSDDGEDEGKRAKKKPDAFDRAYVEKIRREAAEARTRAQKAEAKLKEREDAELGELEKAKKSAEEAEARAKSLEDKLHRAQIRSTIERHARQLGFVDEEVAYRLLDLDDLDLDDDGVPTNAKELLEDLLKKRPYLKGEPSGDNEEKPKKNGVPGTPRGKQAQPASRDEIIEKTKEEMRATGRYHL